MVSSSGTLDTPSLCVYILLGMCVCVRVIIAR